MPNSNAPAQQKAFSEPFLAFRAYFLAWYKLRPRTQREISPLLGIQQQPISRMMRGEQGVSQRVMETFAKNIRVKFDDLLAEGRALLAGTATTITPPPDPEEVIELDRYKALEAENEALRVQNAVLQAKINGLEEAGRLKDKLVAYLEHTKAPAQPSTPATVAGQAGEGPGAAGSEGGAAAKTA